MTSVSVADTKNPPFFDRFTKIMLAVMFVLLLFIFASAEIMTHTHSEGAGTDDTVNGLASTATGHEAHPFLELPGDTQVAAFSVANFFAGVILGYSVYRLFGKKEGTERQGGATSGEGTESQDGTVG